MSSMSGERSAGEGAPPDDVGQPDAVLLAPLTEDTFLHNLHVRYDSDIIYTYVGTALVSVNPCRPLPLYSAELVRAYMSRAPYTLPPHVYAVAGTAYRWARDRNEYQCVVMTGESGAGKTEAARVCLQCCVLAADTVTGSGSSGSTTAAAAAARLTAAGTLLEAFGHAATARNHNASRFGELLDVEFDFRGEPVGGHITHCEYPQTHTLHVTPRAPPTTPSQSVDTSRTSRVSGGAVCAGERNFHVLYQLLAGADAALLKRLKLHRSWESYRILRDGGPTAPADKDHFAFTTAAMRTLGFSSGERGAVLRVLAFLLKLGNVTFEPHHNIDGSLGARLLQRHELEEACALVGVCGEVLAAALGDTAAAAPASAAAAADSSSASGSDADGESDSAGAAGAWGGADGAEWARARTQRLVQAVYARLFTWLVTCVNARLRCPQPHEVRATIGILDVYGLEALAHNGLERLLINYAAERVQAAVVRATVRDQEEYMREAVPYSGPRAPPSDTTISSAAELLDCGTDSILAILEGGARGGATALMSRLQHTDHHRLRVLPPMHFQVVHFGGGVVYCARGMPAKNRDVVCRRCVDVMARATEPLMRALFVSGGGGGGGSGSPRHGGGGGAGLAGRQRALVAGLLRRLPPSPRLVRCVRADALLRPRRFDAQLVRHQLRTQGIVELAVVRRAGWCEAVCARALLRRYSVLSGSGSRLHEHAEGAVEAARALLRSLPIPLAEFAFGRTKVFIRSPRTVWELEALRGVRVQRAVRAVQRAYRAHRARRRHRAQRVIARAYRRYRARCGVGAVGVGAVVGAARVVWRMWCVCAARRYLMTLAVRLPVRHTSPTCSIWPVCPWPVLLGRTHDMLRELHHRWRCRVYRTSFDQTARNRMREKVTASSLFKDRKVTYCRSVSHPFVGDYVRLRASGSWVRGPGGGADRYVVFADVVSKLSRGGGRLSRCLAVVSTHALLLLDARSLRVKRRVPAHSVYRLSLSPHADDLLAVHVRPCVGGMLESSTEELSQCSGRDAHDTKGCLFGESRRRGDVVLRALHVLELATKLFLVVQNAVGAPPIVSVTPQWECTLGGGDPVTVCVHAPDPSAPTAPTAPPRVLRRGSRLDVLL